MVFDYKYLPMYFRIVLVTWRTVEAGWVRKRLKVEKYSGQSGSRNPGGICCGQRQQYH